MTSNRRATVIQLGRPAYRFLNPQSFSKAGPKPAWMR